MLLAHAPLFAAAAEGPRQIPPLFYRRLPPYLPQEVTCACLISHGASECAAACGLGDGSLLGMIYLTDETNFVINTFHEGGDPIADMTVCEVQDRVSRRRRLVALGSRSILVFSSDLALLRVLELDGEEGRSFFVSDEDYARAWRPGEGVCFCRGDRLYTLDPDAIAVEDAASLPGRAASARMHRLADGRRLIVGSTEGGRLWVATPESGLLWSRDLGLEPVASGGISNGGSAGEEPFPMCSFKDASRGVRAVVIHRAAPGGGAAGGAASCYEISEAGAEREWTIPLEDSPTYVAGTALSGLWIGGGTPWMGLGTGGWLRRYDYDGRLLAEAAFPAPVRLVAEVGERICVLDCVAGEGDDDIGSSLSVLTPSLRLLWRESCPVAPLDMLVGNIGGDPTEDIVVVGNTTSISSKGGSGSWAGHGEIDCYISKIGELLAAADYGEKTAAEMASGHDYLGAKRALSRARAIRLELGDEAAVHEIDERLAGIDGEIRVHRILTTALLGLAILLMALLLWKRASVVRALNLAGVRLGLSAPRAEQGPDPPLVRLVMSVLELQHGKSVGRALARLRFNLANANGRTQAGREAATRAAVLAETFESHSVPQIEDVAALLRKAYGEAASGGAPLHEALMDGASSFAKEARAFVAAVRDGVDPKTTASSVDAVCERLEGAMSSTVRTVNRSFYCPARETLDVVIENERESLESAGVTVAVRDTTPRERGVMIRPPQLSFVLQNLISNAVRAMSKSRVRNLSIAMRAEEDGTVIEVADTGAGIPKGVRGRILDSPAGRGRERGEGERAAGSGGFGLARSKEILAAYGGAIRLVRTSAGGSVFEIRLRAWPPGAPRPRE